MFVERLQKDNPKFIEAMVKLQQEGALLPDSYAVDMEQFRANAAAIVASAKEKGIKLYFMLKQIGRNPVLAQELVKLGYDGAVVVDFKEAQVMMRHNIPIGNVGHLVQIPEAMIPQVVAYGPEVITVYTADKVRSISRAAAALGKEQKILIRVFGDGDMIYPGQTAGIHLKDLADFVEQVRDLPGIKIAGMTSFPCFLYNAEKDDIAPTANLQTVLKAKEILIRHFGGYTIQEASGGWVDEEKLYQEYTLVIYLSDTTLEKIHAAADEMISTFDQSSVLIQANETRTEFYSSGN